MDLIIWTTDLRNIIGSQQNILPIYNLPNKIKKTPIVGVYGAEGFRSWIRIPVVPLWFKNEILYKLYGNKAQFTENTVFHFHRRISCDASVVDMHTQVTRPTFFFYMTNLK